MNHFSEVMACRWPFAAWPVLAVLLLQALLSAWLSDSGFKFRVPVFESYD